MVYEKKCGGKVICYFLTISMYEDYPRRGLSRYFENYITMQYLS